MKITIDENPQYGETEILVKCRSCDEKVLTLLARLKAEDGKIFGAIGEKYYPIDEKDILYFESVDKNCFAYTADHVYETDFRLYELEARLEGKGFLRTTKSTVVNLSKIKSIQFTFNSVLVLEMENGEKLTVSRRFAPVLKEKLRRPRG